MLPKILEISPQDRADPNLIYLMIISPLIEEPRAHPLAAISAPGPR
jgi:hypothetical protein